MKFKKKNQDARFKDDAVGCCWPAYLFSRSGMVRFLLMKHIFRLMTFLSLEGEELLCLGEPESSLPL